MQVRKWNEDLPQTSTHATRHTHRFEHHVFVVAQGLRRPLQSVPVVFDGFEHHLLVGAAAGRGVLQRVAVPVDAERDWRRRRRVKCME